MHQLIRSCIWPRPAALSASKGARCPSPPTWRTEQRWRSRIPEQQRNVPSVAELLRLPRRMLLLRRFHFPPAFAPRSLPVVSHAGQPAASAERRAGKRRRSDDVSGLGGGDGCAGWQQDLARAAGGRLGFSSRFLSALDSCSQSQLGIQPGSPDGDCEQGKGWKGN